MQQNHETIWSIALSTLFPSTTESLPTSFLFVNFCKCLCSVDHLNDVDPILQCADGEGEEGEDVGIRQRDFAKVPPTRTRELNVS